MDNGDVGKALQAESISATNVLDINIKTMDSRIYPLRVHNQMSVEVLKQNVASATGVLAHHQRLLYGGRVLRDDQPLSHYNIRDGHTVHLVAQQPGPPSSGRLRNQPAPAAVNSESSRALQATDHDTATTTINIQGYRNMNAIAWALSSFIRGMVPSDTGNSRAGQMNVPDAMTTMFRSVSRMRNNYHAGGSLAFIPPHVDPTLDALVILLITTRRLLRSTADDISMLSPTLRVTSSNSQLRQAIQAEAHRFAAQLVDIGAFFLELGRLTATLQMNGSRPEAVVSSGPAAFITSLGPHPDLFQVRNRPHQPETSSGVPSSSVQPNEPEDPNVGTSSRQPGDDDSNPQDS